MYYKSSTLYFANYCLMYMPGIYTRVPWQSDQVFLLKIQKHEVKPWPVSPVINSPRSCHEEQPATSLPADISTSFSLGKASDQVPAHCTIEATDIRLSQLSMLTGRPVPSHQPRQPWTHGPTSGHRGEPTIPSGEVDSRSTLPTAEAIQMLTVPTAYHGLDLLGGSGRGVGGVEAGLVGKQHKGDVSRRDLYNEGIYFVKRVFLNYDYSAAIYWLFSSRPKFSYNRAIII
ncbi:hypothetical protein Y1Q_0020010 [Alligator mississippiensis]|uniref:Uncharacterized protein n=1 Tax=Alligator mississippiensis TaxID=8496 RepID=A0A151LYS0_ALLMI|nr:hypothetical protein Y1Q_0020010 [Alligator mississippiensis]